MPALVRGLIVCASLAASGCAVGPRSLGENRLRYNEAVKTTTEQQLLLNIVRLPDGKSTGKQDVDIKQTKVPTPGFANVRADYPPK